jgi:hypothetical protein
MRKFLSDYILYISATLCLAVASYFLFKNPEVSTRKFAFESIGSVSPMGKDVRWKSAQDPLWSGVKEQKKVFSRDKVFTGDNSKALVKLKDSSEFMVQPNSLIEIVYERKTPTLSLEEGSFRGEMKAHRPLEIQSKGRSLQLSSQDAKVEIKAEEQKISVVVESGEVEVAEAETGVKHVVTAETPVEFTAQVTEQPTEPLAEEPPEEVILPSQFSQSQYAIEWMHSHYKMVPGVRGFTRESNIVIPVQLHSTKGEHWLELSEFPSFERSEKFKIETSVWSWESARAGMFHLRLVTEYSGKKVYSEPATLQIVLSAPKGEVQTGIDKTTPFAKVAWTILQHPSAQQTEVEYSSTWDFKEPFKKVSSDLSGEVHVPKPGRYHFRFRSLNEQGWPISGHSAVYSVDVKAQPQQRLPAPTPVVRVLASEKPPEPTAPIAKESIAQVSDVEEPLKKKLHFLFGGGLTQYDLQQSDNIDLQSSKLSGGVPLITAGVYYEINQSSRVELIYTAANSTMTTSDGTQSSTAKVKFDNLNLNYRKKLSSERLKNWTLHGGYSWRRSPLLQIPAGGSLLIDQAQLHFVTLGLEYQWSLFKNWETSVGAHVHGLLAGSADQLDGFKASPSLQWELAVLGRRRIFSHFFLLPKLSYRIQEFDYDFAGGGQGSLSSTELSLNVFLQYEF